MATFSVLDGLTPSKLRSLIKMAFGIDITDKKDLDELYDLIMRLKEKYGDSDGFSF